MPYQFDVALTLDCFMKPGPAAGYSCNRRHFIFLYSVHSVIAVFFTVLLHYKNVHLSYEFLHQNAMSSLYRDLLDQVYSVLIVPGHHDYEVCGMHVTFMWSFCF